VGDLSSAEVLLLISGLNEGPLNAEGFFWPLFWLEGVVFTGSDYAWVSAVLLARG